MRTKWYKLSDAITDAFSYLLFRSKLALPAKLLLPVLLLGILFVVPLIFVFRVSFWQISGMQLVRSFTLENYRYFVTEPVYQAAIWRSLRLGMLVSTICLVLGYPLALILAYFQFRGRAFLTFVLITPLFVSVVIRVFGWMVLLEANGLVNFTLQSLGIISKPIRFMNDISGVTIGLVNVLLVFMVIPIIAVLAGIPRSLLEAAQTLGASRLRAWWHVTLPLSVPGVVAGFVLVNALTLSSFIEPRIVGGPRFLVVPIQIYQEVIGVLNWPLGAAMGFVLLLVSFSVSALAFLISRQAFAHLRRQ